MSRGDEPARKVPTAAIVVVAAAIVALTVTAGVVLRQWHTDRPILDEPPHRLVLRLRGNALGSHCEIFDELAPDHAIPSACGLTGIVSEFGSHDAARTVDSDYDSCIVELAPLREVACIADYVEWMVTEADTITVGVYAGSVMRITTFDRATGRIARVTEVPSSVYVEWGLGGTGATPSFASTSGGHFRLERGELVPIAAP